MRSPIFNPKTIALGVAGLALATFLGTNTHAQLTLTGTSYTQNFNNIGTALPTGWSVDTGATATTLGTNINTAFIGTPAANTAWNSTGGGFKNFASATPFANFAAGTVALQTSETNRALGLRQISATDSRVAFILEIANTVGLTNFDLSFKLQSLDSATSVRVTTWTVDYATTSSPTSFTPATVTGTMTTGGNTYSNNTINVDFGTGLDNKTGPVYIRIVALNPTTGSGNRASTGIDDYNLTWTGSGTATNIQVTSKTPLGNNVPLSTNALKVKFDNPIQAGTGQVELFKTGVPAPVTTFTVPSAGVTIDNTDSSATFSSISLENNTSYYVKMTAGSFTKTGGTLPNLAITDPTAWAFSTVDTATPPPPTPLTNLDETFTGCINTAMGDFVQYSTTGAKTWRCSVFGHTDSASVYINGGSAAGVSEDNMDWLISSAPFNFSAMSTPGLSFWQKRRFDGNVTRTIRISTNYVSGSDPASATWTTLNVPAMSNDPALDWEQISGIDLAPYKATPFYLAFTYSCGTNGAYELTYDDMKVSNTVGIFSPSRGQLTFQVLGDATPAAINLGISLKKATDLTVHIFDLTGRRVHAENIKANSGNGVYTIANTGLHAGMYVIRISNGAEYGSVKAVVR